VNVVVVTWDGGSNSQPFEVLCGALTARGDVVRVFSNERHRSVYEALGAVFEPLPMGDNIVGQRRTDSEDMERVVGIWLSPQIAYALRSTLASHRFDVAVVDVTMLTAIAACEAEGVPTVLVHHTLPGASWGGPRADRLSGFVEPVNRVRAELGLKPASSYPELIGAVNAHIAATSAALDSRLPWPVSINYVGPLQPVGAVEAEIALPERFVLVSFSTTWQRQAAPLQRVVDALAALDRPVVVTTGPALDPDEVVAADNTTVIAQIPHSSVLHRVDLVVTHAGHGTALSSLSAGVPLVCMPMGRDQHDVAARVEAVGCGVVLDISTPPEYILRAARRVLSDDAFATAARAIAQAIASEPGIHGALTVIDDIAAPGRQRESAPSQRT
jgi:UDP:flavonoid glycosyltransferase YjiC (YdhE family)